MDAAKIQYIILCNMYILKKCIVNKSNNVYNKNIEIRKKCLGKEKEYV